MDWSISCRWKKRGKGISSLLIQKAEEIAKKENCKSIELGCWAFNKNAFDMYKHIGFSEQSIKFEKKLNNFFAFFIVKVLEISKK